jgi:NAD(P)-dependent dehydrogenase (short-subunit alcohol dehydrogenase family)
MISLEGKVIAVTGAASGMGFATARGLFARGASLSLADINEDALEKAVYEIKAASASAKENNSIITTVFDIRESDQVDAWIDKTVAHFGKLDGAANIAGVLGKSFGVGDLIEISDEEFDFITAVNFKGLFYCIRAELRVMKEGACIVNAGSSTGLEGHPKNSVYSATKHAAIGLTKSAAGEVGARGIRVNCVAP